MISRQMPTTEPKIVWYGMTGLGFTERIDRASSGTWDDRAYQKPRNSAYVRACMTIHAPAGADDGWAPSLVVARWRREDVWDGANFRIDSDNLDLSSRNIAQVKVFIKIDGSGITG